LFVLFLNYHFSREGNVLLQVASSQNKNSIKSKAQKKKKSLQP